MEKVLRPKTNKNFSKSFYFELDKISQPSFKYLTSCKKRNACFSINSTSKSSRGKPCLGEKNKNSSGLIFVKPFNSYIYSLRTLI